MLGVWRWIVRWMRLSPSNGRLDLKGCDPWDDWPFPVYCLCSQPTWICLNTKINSDVCGAWVWNIASSSLSNRCARETDTKEDFYCDFDWLYPAKYWKQNMRILGFQNHNLFNKNWSSSSSLRCKYPVCIPGFTQRLQILCECFLSDPVNIQSLKERLKPQSVLSSGDRDGGVRLQSATSGWLSTHNVGLSALHDRIKDGACGV